MPGSLLGGAMGINIAGWLFGLPLQPGLVSRVIVLASMLIGVLVAGIVMVTATSTIGWLVGKALESGTHAKEDATKQKPHIDNRKTMYKNIQLRLKRRFAMKNETVKTGMKIGATVGGLVFLVFGIMPGFYFGSFGTLILLQKLMGGGRSSRRFS